ncbi:MAG: hypothetical protein MZV70_12140 [Desulfobacterales bacterium]|nr:hypothetical protein [Desulfobacterales bacterium]
MRTSASPSPAKAQELIRSKATYKEGAIPVNVDGGLLSKGHPIGATGGSQIRTIVLQLREEAGAIQVKESGDRPGAQHRRSRTLRQCQHPRALRAGPCSRGAPPLFAEQESHVMAEKKKATSASRNSARSASPP